MDNPTEDFDLLIQEIQVSRLIMDYFDLDAFVIYTFDMETRVFLQLNSWINVSDIMSNIDVSVEDSTQSEMQKINRPDYNCETNNLYISLEFLDGGEHLFGLVGDFNDWDYTNPVIVSEDYPEVYSVCTDVAGTYHILLDEDDNGFSETDLYQDTILEYDFSYGDVAAYEISLTDEILVIHDIESRSMSTAFEGIFQDDLLYTLHITFTIDGEEYTVTIINVKMDQKYSF